jgi:hypothetical protein
MTSIRLGGPSLPPSPSPTPTAVAMPSPPSPPDAGSAAARGTRDASGPGGAILFGDSFEQAGAKSSIGGILQQAVADLVGPGSGQAIEARTKMLPGQGGVRVQYEFSRPLTYEQAAQVLFVGGKVPDGARLVPGQNGNAWVLQSPDIDTHQAALRRMNSRTEVADPNRPGEGTLQWSGGPNQVSNGPKRRDLGNDYGFVVTKRYRLDEGQIPDRMVRALDGKGIGYEVAFDKPMTEKQVMEKLFDQGKFQKGDVKAVPVGTPPAMVWRIQVVGPDALSAVNRPFNNAFQDASAYADLSPNPAIPSGMRSHFDNKTVPRDAKHFPPNVYVWEQEGHIAHVRKDAKGNYHHEFTRLHPTEEKLNSTIRHFMLDKGMPPREGWQAFSKHWDDLNQQMVMALMGALSGGRMPGKAPAAKVHAARPRRQPAPAQQPGATRPQVRSGKTLPGHPPPPPNGIGKPGGGAATKTQPDLGKTLTADPSRARTQTAGPTVDTGGKTVTGGGTVETGGRTVSTTGNAKPGAPRANKPGDVIVGTKIDGPKPLPDGQRITIRTPKGPQNITVGEYRKRHAQAERWMSEQMQKYQASTGAKKGALPPNHEQLSKEAQERFGLDPRWRSVGNPYTHGRL